MVGRHNDRFDGGYGVGQRNLEGGMSLESGLEKELCVSNTWLKGEEKRKATFRIGENETEIHCIDKEGTLTVYSKCEGNPWGVSACLSDSRYR